MVGVCVGSVMIFGYVWYGVVFVVFVFGVVMFYGFVVVFYVVVLVVVYVFGDYLVEQVSFDGVVVGYWVLVVVFFGVQCVECGFVQVVMFGMYFGQLCLVLCVGY